MFLRCVASITWETGLHFVFLLFVPSVAYPLRNAIKFSQDCSVHVEVGLLPGKRDLVDEVSLVLDGPRSSSTSSKTQKLRPYKSFIDIGDHYDDDMIRQGDENNKLLAVPNDAVNDAMEKARITRSSHDRVKKYTIYVKVIDQGLGIKKEKLGLLFKRFVRIQVNY